MIDALLVVYFVIGLLLVLGVIRHEPKIKDNSAFDIMVIAMIFAWPVLILMAALNRIKQGGTNMTKSSWTCSLPTAPPENRMKLAFYKITRNEGMEADDVDFARLTPTHVFLGGKSYRRDEAAALEIEWWKETATSPPLFD